MQIIMEALVGWNVAEQKQTSMGIFGEVLGWSDTTEEGEEQHYIPTFYSTLPSLTNLYLYCGLILWKPEMQQKKNFAIT
jgi:hypothetical protein